jgi:uncharacterized protein YndB with AHSA1/START domain
MATTTTGVTRDVVLPVANDRAWELVTEQEHLERWLAPEVDIELERGGRIEIRLEDGSARAGTVETVEHGRELAFRWHPDRPERREDWESTVRITLEPAVAGTRIVVVESLGAGVPQAIASAALCAWGWERRLTAIGLGTLAPVG